MATGHYNRSTGDLKRRLAASIPHETLKALHQKRPARHLALAARQFLLLGLAFSAGWNFESLWIRIPAALVLGFTVFNFTVLLHEVVHRAVFTGDRPRLYRILGLLYAIPSGISATQFSRWHLDHHRELGSSTGDPKRAYLSPRRNARWFKLLYATPALFPIYFRAARKATTFYPGTIQETIRKERFLSIAVHLTVAALIAFLGGWQRLTWLYVIPVLLVFPPAFTLNRLGQHYDVKPDEPAKWSTRMTPSRLWGVIYLFSNYHMEHHYFPGVPFYNLPALSRSLERFFQEEGIEPRTYRGLLWDWFVRNKKPHTDWTLKNEVSRPEDGLPGSGSVRIS